MNEPGEFGELRGMEELDFFDADDRCRNFLRICFQGMFTSKYIVTDWYSSLPPLARSNGINTLAEISR